MQSNWRRSAPLASGLLAASLVAAACGTSAVAPSAHPASSTAVASTTGTTAGGGSATRASTAARAHHRAAGGASVGTSGSPGQVAAAKPLAGKTIGIDPGHNGRNKDNPGYINKRIWNGRAWESCDTTGTETNGGYTEARFNFNVATYLRADLRQAGARVVLTRPDNNGVGPCVDRRARILNRAHSSVAIDIHADGGPSWGRGFTVIEPIRDGPNNKVITSSVRFGHDVRSALLKYTRMPVSNYYGHNGLIFRDDLAGLNLTTVPKILIETGNMRNATDARLLQAGWFQKRLARAFTVAIIGFLTRR